MTLLCFPADTVLRPALAAEDRRSDTVKWRPNQFKAGHVQKTMWPRVKLGVSGALTAAGKLLPFNHRSDKNNLFILKKKA